jgi:hypothetical protein
VVVGCDQVVIMNAEAAAVETMMTVMVTKE